MEPIDKTSPIPYYLQLAEILRRELAERQSSQQVYQLPSENELSSFQGITRATVLALARREKIPAHDTRLTMYDVYTADEIFVTGSGAGIVPVTEVDKRPVSNGRPGETTMLISRLYDEEVKTGDSAYE